MLKFSGYSCCWICILRSLTINILLCHLFPVEKAAGWRVYKYLWDFTSISISICHFIPQVTFQSVQVYGLMAQAIPHSHNSYNFHENRWLRRGENFPLVKRVWTSLPDYQTSENPRRAGFVVVGNVSKQASLIPPLTEPLVYYLVFFPAQFLWSQHDSSGITVSQANRTWIFTTATRGISTCRRRNLLKHFKVLHIYLIQVPTYTRTLIVTRWWLLTILFVKLLLSNVKKRTRDQQLPVS